MPTDIRKTNTELADKAVTHSKALYTLATKATQEILNSSVDGVIHIEASKKGDFMHHRNSGLDQVALRIMNERRQAYIVDYSWVVRQENFSVVLGRVLQNCRLCKKKGVAVIFIPGLEKEVNWSDLVSFWKSCGVDEWLLAHSHKRLEKLHELCMLRASKGYIAEGFIKQE